MSVNYIHIRLLSSSDSKLYFYLTALDFDMALLLPSSFAQTKVHCDSDAHQDNYSSH